MRRLLFLVLASTVVSGTPALAGEPPFWLGPSQPFGITDAYANFDHIPNVTPGHATRILHNLHIGYVRFGAAKYGGLDWELSQPEEGAPFYWDEDAPFIREAAGAGLNVMVTLNPIAPWDQAKCHTSASKMLPCDMEQYRAFVAAAADEFKDEISYWGIHNEVDGGVFWTDTAENYAVLVKETASIIRTLDPGAKIVLSAIEDPQFLAEVLGTLEGLSGGDGEPYFDIADIHVFKLAEPIDQISHEDNYDYKEGKVIYTQVREVFDQFGYTDIPIWVTETATYSSRPTIPRPWPAQDENEHAGDLVKRIVYPLSYGVQNVFWVTVVEWWDWSGIGPNNYFDNVGLIRNPKHQEGVYRKLAYYTYKKLIEFLHDSEWTLTESIWDNQDNVYGIRFERWDGPVYIVWWDWFDESSNALMKYAAFPVDFSGMARATFAVPQYSSGTQVPSYEEAFTAPVAQVRNGKVDLLLNKSPVFIEKVN